MPWISLSSHTECIQCVQVPGILSPLVTLCPHPSIKLCPFSLHTSLCSKFWLLSNRHHMVCKGVLYWVQMMRSTKCSLRSCQSTHISSQEMNIENNEYCLQEEEGIIGWLLCLGTTTSSGHYKGAGSRNLESLSWSLNKQLKKAKLLRLRKSKLGKKYYWACSWLPPGLSCWTATGILLIQSFHTGHRSCWCLQ